jgi:hypothetical protein
MKRIAAIAFAAALAASPMAMAQSTKSKGVATDAPGHSGDPKKAAPGQQMKNSDATGPGASQFAPGNPAPPAHGAGGKSK